MQKLILALCACGMPRGHWARARIPAMPGEASTHTAQQERQRHPHQHEVSARGPRQAAEAKAPPRAHILDTSGNSASGTAAPHVSRRPEASSRKPPFSLRRSARCLDHIAAATVAPKRRGAKAPLPATGHHKQTLAKKHTPPKADAQHKNFKGPTQARP